MQDLIIARLNETQIQKAKEVNGPRKQITHVLICGTYGQIFGTEKQCLKYFTPWKRIFKDLFNSSKRLESIEKISDFKTTFNLVLKLQEDYNKLPASSRYKYKKLLEELEQEKQLNPTKRSWLSRLLKF
ncbi:hypothetical protein ABMA79_05980 [Halobacteriovorax sp. HFRX-2_2]|uniref:hypothetical protein n=1 Tax=unclassified Halobacteriovorax TaxID=2639665 RepID=UPI00371FC6A6